MAFDLIKKFDFIPQLSFPDHQPLEVIYETKLHGITLASDLSWWPHNNDITKRATSKLWVLIRFKSLGGTEEQLRRVRSTLEFGPPIFHSGLTKEQSTKVEKVQNKPLVNILGSRHQNYETALQALKLERLVARRLSLCYNFSVKCTNSPKHYSMFPTNPNYRQSMRSPKQFLERLCQTSRHFNSAIPFLTRLLNTGLKSKS